MSCPTLSNYDFSNGNFDFGNFGNRGDYLSLLPTVPDIILPSATSPEELNSPPEANPKKKEDSAKKSPKRPRRKPGSKVIIAAKNKDGKANKNAGNVVYHQVGTVRKFVGLSLQTSARLLNISVEEASRQEKPSTDLHISELLNWSFILNEPKWFLLGEEDVSTPYKNRAKMVLVLKNLYYMSYIITLKYPDDDQLSALICNMLDSLRNIVNDDELVDGIVPWTVIGKSHQPKDCGKIVEDLRDPRDW